MINYFKYYFFYIMKKKCLQYINWLGVKVRTVSSVYQHKNHITITYNFTSSDGLLIFGSGFFNNEPHKEVITFSNEEHATEEIKGIEFSMKQL